MVSVAQSTTGVAAVVRPNQSIRCHTPAHQRGIGHHILRPRFNDGRHGVHDHHLLHPWLGYESTHVRGRDRPNDCDLGRTCSGHGVQSLDHLKRIVVGPTGRRGSHIGVARQQRSTEKRTRQERHCRTDRRVESKPLGSRPGLGTVQVNTTSSTHGSNHFQSVDVHRDGQVFRLGATVHVDQVAFPNVQGKGAPQGKLASAGPLSMTGAN